ncbi:RagB/SusD family nutrient uptake outer membrane protein [Arenibacter palladensis]|uniref:RagB/SusD family nutrient uptake outer membrane protein n=1 Tax=Arenibacter palladensis TaxID=237373 RepID=UPI002FD6B43A
MKNIKKILSIVTTVLVFGSCSDFLEVPPKGIVSENDLKNIEGSEGLVMAAYASLGNDHWLEPYTSMWPYGNVRSDDAYKGGLGTSDQGDYHLYETFSAARPDQDRANRMWTRIYIGVQRANNALRGINELDQADYPNKTQRIAEMRFLRGHFHFLLKILFKKIPYIHEEIETDELNNISNVDYTNDELWDKIAEDFQFAIDNLSPSQEDVGRPTENVAKAYLAKLRLYQAYEQDEQNNVIQINATRLEEVVNLSNQVINSGNYGLHGDYANNYLWEYDNGVEAIYSVQRSKDDGSPAGRVDVSNALNFPMYSAYGCCSFHRPSFNLVNAFQTGEDGLPKFNSYNVQILMDSLDFRVNSFDPRLDHTVGIPSHPYKYQTNVIYNTDEFTRGPQVYGPFSAMKEVQQVDCPCLTQATGYPYPATSKNNDIIKYSDVLLWKAEALIELGRQNEALPIINEIRQRAKNSTNRLVYSNGELMANYNIQLYEDGVNVVWNQENARLALRWERRLEFALEGIRFFDLVRWGIAAETINNYFQVEKNRVPFLSSANFTKNRDEYLPIPQQQIDLSEGVYKQNYGW